MSGIVSNDSDEKRDKKWPLPDESKKSALVSIIRPSAMYRTMTFSICRRERYINV